MKPIVARVLQAVTAELAECSLDEVAEGGTVSIVLKLDAAGCPKRIAVRTERERDVARRRPCVGASPLTDYDS